MMKGVFYLSRKGENIHKRKDGRWEGRYKKSRNVNGKIIYGYIYGKTYREVREKMHSLTVNPDLKKQSCHDEKSFEEVLSIWMENNKIRFKGATETRYRYLIDAHIVPELGGMKLSCLTATKINTFLVRKLESGRLDGKGGLSSAYVRNIMLIIHATLKFAADEGFCQPLKSPIFKPTAAKEELSVLSREQQKRLEQYLLQDVDRTKAGILISLHTGLRIGEVCALEWNDIDLQQRIIHVRHTVARVKDRQRAKTTKMILDTPKTLSSARDIPISSYLFPILQGLKKHSYSPFVLSETNSFLNPRTYDYRYHRLLHECGLEAINYHALRHTFATRCIEAGVDVKSLSEILGHANVSTTLNTYVHSSMDLKRVQIEKIAALSG